MILQALNRYYDILLEDEDLKDDFARFGYGTVDVSFALDISKEGELLNVLPLFVQVPRGKKMIERPRPMIVSARIKKAGSNPPSNFMCENSAFMLGISGEDETNPEYSSKRFETFCKFHNELLTDIDNDGACAVLKFLDSHNPAQAREQAVISRQLEAILKGGNLVFRLNGKFVHDEPAIRTAWETYLAGKDAMIMQCLVTGDIAPVARLHPSLKGVSGTLQGRGTLVGFNKPSFRSYNRDSKAEKGLNSPISEKATFAYTTVLNYLLSDANPNKKLFLGDTTVVYWAESENRAYESAFASFVDPAELEQDNSTKQTGRKKAEKALQTVTDKVKRAKMIDLDALLDDLKDEDPRFYILGLSPNAARVSVRFFITDPFKKIIDNIKAHYRDLAIVKEYEEQPNYLPVWRIINETVSKKAKEKNAAPLLAGAVFHAILINAQYPAALYYAIINRIRADMDNQEKGKKKIEKINYVRAAIIKAFLIRKYRHQENSLKEVLTMALNEQSTIPAYLLGRLFAVLEGAQKEAAKPAKLNATIKDRYFTSACANPASVFPVLLRLSQHHISKAEYGHIWDRRIQEIMWKLDVEKKPYPKRLTLDKQGVFILGYYHQRADFFKPKDNDKDNDEKTEPEIKQLTITL